MRSIAVIRADAGDALPFEPSKYRIIPCKAAHGLRRKRLQSHAVSRKNDAVLADR
jgi:hypothetical protein